MNHLIKLLLIGVIFVLITTAAFGQGVTIDLGKTQTGRYMNLVGNTPGSDGEITSPVFIASEYAAQNKGTSMYFAIDDSFFYQLPTGCFATVNVEYFDAPGVQIRLVYDALSNHTGREHSDSIITTGTNTWKAKSFTIDDAYFGNGLANGADLKLVASSGTMTINAVSVIPFEAYFDYGSAPDSLHMHWTSLYSGDSHVQIVTKEGQECVTTVGTSQYLYMDVADSFLWNGEPTTNVFLTVEYYDEDSSLSFRIQYDADGTNRFKPTPYVYGKGRNSFRTYTFEFSDALFMNRQSPLSDFRVCLPMPGLAINRIMIARLPKKPFPIPTNIANVTAYKSQEAPVADGSLREWNWTPPYPVVQRFNADSSRFDEFYRTWVLNNANAPVAETGETGVSDPGVPGNWDPRDLGGSLSVLWDDANLYFSVNVKDNVVNTAGANWDNKDGFGFFIDVAHDYNSIGTTPIARRDDQSFMQGEHFFFFPADQAEPGTWCHSTSQTGEAMPGSVTRSVVRTDSAYIIKASVPLSLIADSLTWHPGVTGDKDAFDPLFAWMINDNDGIGESSGRVMYGGHSADDEFWGTLFMKPNPLVDRGIMIDPGVTNYESYLKQVETQVGGDGLTTPVERGGKTGVMLNSGYFYLDINDTIWNAAPHKHALASVEYYDSASTGARFRLQYESDSTIYHSLPYIYVGNTRTWKTATFEMTNAKFQSHQNGHADFRFNNGSKDLVINQVHVAMADLWIDLGDSSISSGIVESHPGGDGFRAPATVGGVNCERNFVVEAPSSRYLYHAVSDSLIFSGNHRELFLTAEYYDTTSSGGVGLTYDGMSSIWTTAPSEAFILGTNQWKLHTFHLTDARFENRQSGASDFRLVGQGTGSTFINRILVGSIDGVATSVESKQTEPFAFRLEQNYPNPFNPVTTIKYTVGGAGSQGPGAGEAGTRGEKDGTRGGKDGTRDSGLGTRKTRLVVYDLLGRQVATLVDEAKAPGFYEVHFDGSGLASGVYFYRLSAGSFLQTRKMLLVK